jgi:hypothetical protein
MDIEGTVFSLNIPTKQEGILSKQRLTARATGWLRNALCDIWESLPTIRKGG